MNLNKLIQPAILLTFVFLLYTGCKRAATRYIYLNPTAMATLTTGPIPEFNTVSFAGLFIEVNTLTQTVEVASNFSLPGNLAYATSIRIPTPIALEKITDLRIRPLYDYNATYPANSDMTNACLFVNSSSQLYVDTFSKEELIASICNVQSEFESSFRQGPFYIKLNEPPSGTREQQFIIELITDKHSRLADTTQPIILTP